MADDQVGDHGARRDDPHARVACHRADRVDTGERLTDDATRERRRRLVRFPGTDGHRRQTQAAAVDVALARHVVDEKLADRFLRAVRGLGCQYGVVRHRIGERSAENGERAREDELRRARQLATALEQRASRVEVDAHADVELRFRLAAHHRRKMEDGIGVVRHDPFNQRGLGKIAGHHRDAPVGDRRGDDVDQHQVADLVRLAAGVGERAASEEGAREATAQEAGAAGDHDAHGRILKNAMDERPAAVCGLHYKMAIRSSAHEIFT